MKAVVYEKNGSRDPFLLREIDKPVPGDNEVLIKIHAVSLNAGDYRLFRMGLGIPKNRIFGNSFAGNVEAAGKNVRSFKIGDEVVADTSDAGFGGMAEYAVAPESTVVLKPEEISFEKAAALPVASITALQALRDTGCVKLGQKVLIDGASGGVGTYAVQLAKYYGAEVTAVCSTGNTAMARDLGADFVIDYTKEDFTKNGKQYDLILAVNGYHPLYAYKRALKPHGICVMIGGTFRQIIKFLCFGPILSGGGKKMRFLAAKTNAKDLAFMLDLAAGSKVNPVIDKIYPLSEGGVAFKYMEAGHARGKVVIRVMETI